jgi:N-acetylmuramic acid 6-phosphate etherase
MPVLQREKRRTEQRNPASRNLDRLSSKAVLRLMNREDRKVALAVRRQIPAITRAVDLIVRGLHKGGRLIYVGAGTSGRLAVLDAAECPPTFGTSQEVQALIAGGRRALTAAVEGAEDSVANAARDLRQKRLTRGDVVVGIAASGTTPYVLGALHFARKRRAATISVTCNRLSPLSKLADVAIAIEVGPEIIAGSTRLKAGTAQKLVLNMLSTAAMVQLGHVYENLMIDVAMTNQKLRQRGLRILAEASGKDLSSSEHALRQSGHNLRVALLMLKLDLDSKAARIRLRRAGGNLRRALGEGARTDREWINF